MASTSDGKENPKEWTLIPGESLHIHSTTTVKVVIVFGKIELYGIPLLPQKPYFLKSGIFYAPVFGGVIQLYESTNDLLAYVSSSSQEFISQCVKIATHLDIRMQNKRKKEEPFSLILVGQQTELTARYVINYTTRLGTKVILTDLRTRENMIGPRGTIGSLFLQEPLQDNLGKKIMYAWGSNRQIYYESLDSLAAKNRIHNNIVQVILCPNQRDIIQYVYSVFQVSMTIVIGIESLFKTLVLPEKVQWMDANLFDPTFITPCISDFVNRSHMQLEFFIQLISVEEQIVPKDALPLTQPKQSLPSYQIVKDPILPTTDFFAAMLPLDSFVVLGFAQIEYKNNSYKIHSIPFDETKVRFLLWPYKIPKPDANQKQTE